MQPQVLTTLLTAEVCHNKAVMLPQVQTSPLTAQPPLLTWAVQTLTATLKQTFPVATTTLANPPLIPSAKNTSVSKSQVNLCKTQFQVTGPQLHEINPELSQTNPQVRKINPEPRVTNQQFRPFILNLAESPTLTHIYLTALHSRCAPSTSP
jgi:hypothetical protein